MSRNRRTLRPVREGEGLPHGEETTVSGFKSQLGQSAIAGRFSGSVPTGMKWNAGSNPARPTHFYRAPYAFGSHHAITV